MERKKGLASWAAEGKLNKTDEQGLHCWAEAAETGAGGGQRRAEALLSRAERIVDVAEACGGAEALRQCGAEAID